MKTLKLSFLAVSLFVVSLAMNVTAQVIVGAPNYYGFFEIAASSGTNCAYLAPINTGTGPGVTNTAGTATYDLRYSPEVTIVLEANSTNSVRGNGTAGTVTIIWATSYNGTTWDYHPVTGKNTITTKGGALALTLAETNTLCTFTNIQNPAPFIRIIATRGVGTNAVTSIAPRVFSRIKK